MKKCPFWRSRGIARGTSCMFPGLIGLGFGERKASVSPRRPVLGVRSSLGGPVGVKNAFSGNRVRRPPDALGADRTWFRQAAGLRGPVRACWGPSGPRLGPVGLPVPGAPKALGPMGGETGGRGRISQQGSELCRCGFIGEGNTRQNRRAKRKNGLGVAASNRGEKRLSRQSTLGCSALPAPVLYGS